MMMSGRGQELMSDAYTQQQHRPQQRKRMIKKKMMGRGLGQCIVCAALLASSMYVGSHCLEVGGVALYWPCAPIVSLFFAFNKPSLFKWLTLSASLVYGTMLVLDCGKLRGDFFFINFLFMITDVAEVAAVTLCLRVLAPSPPNVIRSGAITNVIMLFPLVMAPIKEGLNTLLIYTCFGSLHLPLWETLAIWLIGDFFTDFFIIHCTFVLRYYWPEIQVWFKAARRGSRGVEAGEGGGHSAPLYQRMKEIWKVFMVGLAIIGTSYAAILDHFRFGRQPLFYLAGRLLFPAVGLATVAFGQLGGCISIIVSSVTMLISDLLVNDERADSPTNFMSGSGRFFQVLVSPILIVMITWSISYLAVALAERQDALSLLSEKNAQLVQQGKELREAKLAAEKALSSKTEFFARVSHEFRTPLNVVLGFSEELTKSKDPSLNAETADRIQYILAAGESLLRIVDDILELFRLTSTGRRQLQINFTSVDIFSLFNTICDLVEAISKESSVHFLKHFDPTLPRFLNLDRVRFSQLVMNLASNACKYSRAKNGVVSLRLANEGPMLERPGYMTLRLDVQDNGPGIPPELKDRIFESFFRAGSTAGRSSKGHGLGLAITKELVDLLQGRIVVQSTMGLGSLFSIYLPVQIAEAGDEWGLHPSSSSKAEVPVQGLKILSVEDIMVNQIVLGGMLHQDGHTVVFVETGSAALATIDSSFDLVLLDLQLPDMHGNDVLNAIRKSEDPKLSSMPIVVVSALALDKEKQECALAGADSFVTKPVKLNLLRRELRHLANMGRIQVPKKKAGLQVQGNQEDAMDIWLRRRGSQPHVEIHLHDD